MQNTTTTTPLTKSQSVTDSIAIDPKGNLTELFPGAGVHEEGFRAELIAELDFGRTIDIFRRDYRHDPSELYVIDGRHNKLLKKGKYLKLKGGLALMHDKETGAILVENLTSLPLLVTAHALPL